MAVPLSTKHAPSAGSMTWCVLGKKGDETTRGCAHDADRNLRFVRTHRLDVSLLVGRVVRALLVPLVPLLFGFRLRQFGHVSCLPPRSLSCEAWDERTTTKASAMLD